MVQRRWAGRGHLGCHADALATWRFFLWSRWGPVPRRDRPLKDRANALHRFLATQQRDGTPPRLECRRWARPHEPLRELRSHELLLDLCGHRFLEQHGSSPM